MASSRWIIAVLAVAVTTLGLAPAADPAPGPFPDVAADSPFATEIGWLVSEGIATGYGDGLFRPAAPVSRQAMVAYLFRLANPGAERPTCSADAFPDVPADAPFCGEIAWAVARGITTGYEDGTFRPTALISRAAIVTFLYRLQAGGTTEPACDARPFPDVAIGPMCGAIEWAVGEGIVRGYEDGTFRPTAQSSRQAVAAFLHRFAVPAGPGGDLVIAVTNLPDGVAAPVVLVSPVGERVAVTATTVIADAAPGRWLVEVPPVQVASERRPGGTDTYWAEAPAEVRHGGTATDLVVDYFTVTPHTTVILPEGGVAGVEGEPGEERVVSLAAGTQVAVGDVMVSGSSVTVPTGLLGRVTAIVSTDPLVVVTEPATLPEAVDRGRLEFDQEVTVSTVEAAGGLEARARTTGNGRTVTSGGFLDELRDSFECEREADSVEFDTEFDLDAYFAVGIEWGAWYEFGIDAVSVDATVEQSSELVLEAELELECELASELLARPYRFPSMNVMVGPVPVSVTPQLQLFLEGEVEASARLVTGVTQSLEAAVGVGFDGENWSTRRQGPDVTFDFLPPQPQLQAQASLGVRARLSFELYGVIGPYVSVTPGIGFDANLFDALAVTDLDPAQPVAELALFVHAGAGIASGVFDIEYGRDDIVRYEHPLWSRSFEESAADYTVREVSASLPTLEGVPGPPTSVTVTPGPGEVIALTCLEADPPPFHTNGTALTVSRLAGTAGTVHVRVVDPVFDDGAGVLPPGEAAREFLAKLNYTGFEALVIAGPGTGPLTLRCESWIVV